MSYCAVPTDVDIAGDGPEAINQLRRVEYDLVLMVILDTSHGWTDSDAANPA